MINSWSLLYDELYGVDEMTDKTYPVENAELNDDKMGALIPPKDINLQMMESLI